MNSKDTYFRAYGLVDGDWLLHNAAMFTNKDEALATVAVLEFPYLKVIAYDTETHDQVGQMDIRLDRAQYYLNQVGWGFY